MFNTTKKKFEEFKQVLSSLTEEEFVTPCEELSLATIGQHTRHIIELYVCLIEGYDKGEVNYDDRKRDKRIETDIAFALYKLDEIELNISKEEKAIVLKNELSGLSVDIPSYYTREVLYNLEHMIHHEAIIKIGLKSVSQIELNENFGVAPSTIEFRKACAQ